MDRIAIIGAGNVGATASHIVVQKELANVVLVDIAAGVAKGKSMDKMQAMAIHGSHMTIHGTGDFSEIAGSSLVVVTAGFPRGPGMSRDELLKKNAAVIKSVAGHIKDYAPEAIVIVVTNPLDEMTTLGKTVTGLPRARVFGMGGVLDTGRFVYFISQKFGVKPAAVKAAVIGVHGDKMIPLVNLATVDGRPIKEMVGADELAELAERTRYGGAEIISHLEKGSAFYGPGAGIAKMVEAVLHDTKETLPCSVCLEGEYGISGVCLGVPAVIGRQGIEKVVDIPLTATEAATLKESAENVRSALEGLDAESP
ncbi:MAG: malate dehydrogenase [Actinomycetota bacterium]